MGLADGNLTDTPKRDGGTLEGWYQKFFTFKSGKEGFSAVFGHITGDNRWRDGSPIQTSNVFTLNEEDRILETQNTIYRLGAPADTDDITSIGSLIYNLPSGIEPYEIDDVTTPKPLTDEEINALNAMIF